MTAFDKTKFTTYGGYIMYHGEYEGQPVYEEPCHPTRLGKGKELFIARFKYGPKPYKNWINFLAKNFTVEEYVALTSVDGMEGTPLKVMESKGYVLPHVKKMLKERGYPLTPAGRDRMIRDDIEARKLAA